MTQLSAHFTCPSFGGPREVRLKIKNSITVPSPNQWSRAEPSAAVSPYPSPNLRLISRSKSQYIFAALLRPQKAGEYRCARSSPSDDLAFPKRSVSVVYTGTR
jgi:hypothetical protein